MNNRAKITRCRFYLYVSFLVKETIKKILEAFEPNFLQNKFRSKSLFLKFQRSDMITRKYVICRKQEMDGQEHVTSKTKYSCSVTLQFRGLLMLKYRSFGLLNSLLKSKFSYGIIPSNEQLINRQWHGDVKCKMCGEAETVARIFIACPYKNFGWSVFRDVFRWSHVPQGLMFSWLVG